MKIEEMFLVGDILEWEDKDKKIVTLSGDDAIITGKTLNKNKIILHLKRESDGSEGNVFVRLQDAFSDQFPNSKKLLASKKVLGLTLNQFKKFSVDDL